MISCPSCGNAIPEALRVCPSCRALVHRARLEAIAAEAEAHTKNGDHAAAARVWRDALPLLPEDSKQYAAIVARIEEAVAKSGKLARQAPAEGTKWAKILAPLGIAGLLIWKLKFLFVALITKGKLLLLGFSKFTTVLSGLAFLGVYWKAWGWKYALAVVVMIYIHEIGHVAAMARRGMPAEAPMFIPGVGAFVRMGDVPVTPSEDAAIGLAGPLWGLGAAIGAYATALVTGSPFWLAVANTAAILNIFNLSPVWQLDGSRGFNAFNRLQRWLMVALIMLAWLAAREGMLVLVGLIAIWRALQKEAPAAPGWRAFATYTFLLAALSALVTLTMHRG